MTFDPTEISLDELPLLGVAWWKGKQVDGRRLDTSPSVAGAFKATAATWLAKLGDMTEQPYSPEAAKDNDQYFLIDRSSLDDAGGIVSTILATPELDAVASGQFPMRTLLLYAFVFEQDTSDPSPATRVAFLRKHNAYQSGQAGKMLTRATNVLTKIAEPVFAFDEGMDLIVTKDHLLVFSEGAFDYLFKNDAFIQSRVPTWVDRVAASIPLSDSSVEDITARAQSDTRVRRRLEAITSRGHLAVVSIDQVANYAHSQGIDVGKLVVDKKIETTGVGVEVVLKLLNEDLVIGALSQEQFEIERKSPR